MSRVVVPVVDTIKFESSKVCNTDDIAISAAEFSKTNGLLKRGTVVVPVACKNDYKRF